METKQKFHLLFYLNKQRMKNGLCPLYVRVYVDSKRSVYATSHFINERNWDPKKMRVLSTEKNYTLLNAYMENTKAKFNKIFLAAAAQGQMISAKDLRNIVIGRKDESQESLEKTIADAFDYHNTKMGEQVRIGAVVQKTLLRYIITRNKVMAFIKHQYKKDNMYLKDMRHRFITEFWSNYS